MFFKKGFESSVELRPVGQSQPQFRKAPAVAQILIAEDERNIRVLLRTILVSAGYEVTEAASGREAVARLEAGRHVDLIVSDVRMPEMDGAGLVAWVRKNGHAMPILLISAYDDSARKAMAMGATEFLSKPFTRDQLVECVRRLLHDC